MIVASDTLVVCVCVSARAASYIPVVRICSRANVSWYCRARATALIGDGMSAITIAYCIFEMGQRKKIAVCEHIVISNEYSLNFSLSLLATAYVEVRNWMSLVGTMRNGIAFRWHSHWAISDSHEFKFHRPWWWRRRRRRQPLRIQSEHIFVNCNRELHSNDGRCHILHTVHTEELSLDDVNVKFSPRNSLILN